ncbi:MAG: DUF2784 domain-containing protein [Lautropia sp.]
MPGYQLLADVVLLVHFGVVAFVVGGLAYAVAGSIRCWPGARSVGFRVAHLVAIGVVVVQSWLGMVCPLTALESWLRAQAGAAAYGRSFIEHWVRRIVFYEAPFAAFVVGYTIFGLIVVWAWWRFPPRRRERDGAGQA